jgi:hypothetical protein
MNGQLDGTNYDGRQEQCSLQEIKLPESAGVDKRIKIKKFKA